MELHEFIRDTLVSIGRGVTEANEMIDGEPPFKLRGGENDNIEFEVSVFAEEQTKAKAEGGASLKSILKVSLGASLEAGNKDGNRHVIRFKVKVNERVQYTKSGTSQEDNDG